MTLPVTTTQPQRRPTRKTGKVLSISMDKTIVVQVEYRKMHPKFKKIIKLYSKFYAHDSSNKAKEGDTVIIEETRPLSKLKRWRLVEIQQ